MRALRESHGLTQPAFAARINAPRSVISGLETGKLPPYPRVIENMADAFALDADEVYAMADRVPEDLVAALAGNLDAIRAARQAIGIPFTPTRKAKP